MEWFHELLFGSGIGHSILLLAVVIFAGILLGKIKIAGISLGITWILFVGIILSHFNMRMDPQALHFLKEFGLILFVYSVGLQVGPGFFSSFKSSELFSIEMPSIALCTDPYSRKSAVIFLTILTGMANE